MDALTAAGAERIYADRINVSLRKRPQIDQHFERASLSSPSSKASRGPKR